MALAQDSTLWDRLVKIQAENATAGKIPQCALDPKQRAEDWFSDGVQKEFDQMMLEFSGETVGRIPLCNLFDIPEGIDQQCLAEVVNEDGCAFPVGFQPDLGAFVDVNGSM